MENETEDTKEIEKQHRSAADYIFSEACPREALHHSVRLFSKTIGGKQIKRKSSQYKQEFSTLIYDLPGQIMTPH
jgi:hypothetical protein